MIKEAKYFKSTVPNADTFVHITHEDGTVIQVPMNEENADYAEILKQVKEGTLTIKDAE
jgi:hypothetical protein